MAPQTVLITGCSTGIGFATALLLARDEQTRFKVYATMRNLESKTNLEEDAGSVLNKTLLIRELDVTKDSTIKAVADEMLRDNGRIDVLVNNTGIIELDGVDERSIEWCQAMMDTNYWGVVRTTNAVLPAMRKQKSGRIINVSSSWGIQGTPFYTTYTASKFALEGYTESIAPVLRDGYDIKVSLVEPGPVKTAAIEGLYRTPFEEQAKDFDPVLRDQILPWSEGARAFSAWAGQSAEEIARLHMEIILNKKPHLWYQTSEMVAQMAAQKFRDPTTDFLLDAFKQIR